MYLSGTDKFPPPTKIISLVPSLTELLYHFNLDTEVTGITKFCVHPASWYKTKTRVGGTKTINTYLVKKMAPDLVIANKEENIKEQVDEIACDFNVWVTDVNRMQDAIGMIKDIGMLVNKTSAAVKLVDAINTAFQNLKKPERILSAAYLIWQNPFMAAGGGTFISDMMKLCGLQNVFENKNRYPSITLEELKNANCRLILLSSEPFPFSEKHRTLIQEQLPGKKIILVDGEMFSWYGSRLLMAAPYFKKLMSEI
ncbi:MAG: ABC transporter substrate-binding protein [Chitinophagaceae bacterium]|nr:ABC transporter substrate-binding protein [Chitinophagaceae bacterium]